MTSRWTWHGGGLEAARAHFGDGDLPWLDLSTGINPHPWPGVEGLAIDWRRLPDEAALRALERAAAEHFGVDPAHVCALPGTEMGLRLVGDLLPRPAHYLTPCYRTHADMAGARPVPAPNEAGGATLILANPNNPDGRVFDKPAMRRLLARRWPEGWLVVDEAFADTSPEVSLAGEVGDHQPLVVFRSFGKFFGLAGVRLGFVLGPSALIAGIRSKLGAWPVSAAAIAMGEAAYRDRAWIAAMRDALHRRAQALDEALGRAGFHPIGACPLFRLIEVDDAAALFARLARRAILTRPFDEHRHWLRIGLPASEADLARLEAALRDG